MSRPQYPSAHRQDRVEEIHGHRVADPYRRLEDPDDDATKGWLIEQDELFHREVDGLPGRDRLRARVRELLGAGTVGAPTWRGDRRFFVRRTAEQEHAVLYTVDPGEAGEPGTERALIDPVALDPTHTTTLDHWQPDKEGRLLAYQLSHGGDEESRLYVMDVATGETVEGPIDRCRYTPIAWLPGGEAYYYVRRLPADQVPPGEDQYHRRVFWHRVGADPEADDVTIFGDGRDKTNYYGVGVSRDGRWLTLSSSQGTAPRNDAWIADLTTCPAEAPELRVVQEGVDAETGVRVGRDGRAYVFTDRDAPRGRLCVADPADLAYETWRDLLPEHPEAVLSDFAILDDLERPLLLAGWTRHAISEITVHDLATGERVGEVPLPGLGTIGGIAERPEGGHEAWFAYGDNTTPVSVQHFDARTGETRLWASPPGTVEVPDVETHQVTYTSYDGTEVRMLVIARPGGPGAANGPGASGPGAVGPRPTVLYGYGGFNVPLTPAYSATVLAWVEAGGVYAVANLRGGSEEGEEWHRAGMLGKKQNVFDDFHAAAEKLIADGWTTPEQLAISGGSNGGLLVGAAITQRPELFAAAVCSAPLLDMVRYEKFGLGQTWNVEYGSAADPGQFEWLYAYSPYHHVREGVAYPATLFTVFDSDTRVDPLHARKMCAALQHATAGAGPILLRNEAEVGHGARAVSRTVDLSVDTLAFMAAHTGLVIGDRTRPVTAFDRVIKLLDRPPAEPDVSRGYLDLLGSGGEAHDTVAQRFMRSRLLPRIYEDVWRPVLFGLVKGGPFGPGTDEEYALARDRLRLAAVPDGTVLDVACGPGNVTRALADGMTRQGLVVGVDASATMLDRAVAGTGRPTGRGENGAAEIAYVRGDAIRLPFNDAAFDAVCCFGALYLFDDPWAAIDGMARVLKPGGRVALLTSRRPDVPLVGAGNSLLGRLAGIRIFASGEVPAELAARGFTDVEARSYGLMQLVSATRA